MQFGSVVAIMLALVSVAILFVAAVEVLFIVDVTALNSNFITSFLLNLSCCPSCRCSASDHVTLGIVIRLSLWLSWLLLLVKYALLSLSIIFVFI